MNKKNKGFKSAFLSTAIALTLTFTGVHSVYYPHVVYAYDEKIGYVTGEEVNVRTGAGVSNSVICILKLGAEVKVIGEDTASNGVMWYKIQFEYNDETRTGYMNHKYIRTVEPTDENPEDSKDSDLTDDGQKDDNQSEENQEDNNKTDIEDPDYELYLDLQGFPESYRDKLRELHKKHPTWTFVALPTKLEWKDVVAAEAKVGANLVPVKSITSWKSLEEGAFDWTASSWIGKDTASWVAASGAIVKYYLDPRNFLKETNEILQFQSLTYIEGEQTKEGLANILEGTFMATDEYYEIFMKVGKETGVNPYHLASRCRQEVGVKGSNSTYDIKDAEYAEFNGYYNYFNIGASPSSEHNSMYNGLQRAKDEGWDTPEKSILGGAKVVGSKYVLVGQNTLYLQKFDVVDGGNGYYWHQYMTNLQAAASESATMKKAYKDLNEAVVTYHIPVYLNMPEYVFEAPTYNGSVNCVLSSLAVDGYEFTEEFDPYKTEYKIKETVSKDTEFSVNGTAYADGAQITSTTNFDEGKIEVVCTGKDGEKLTYTVNFELDKIIEIKKGDINRDGSINISDAYMLMEYIVGTQNLEEEQISLADINEDTTVDVLDALQILKIVSGEI